MSLGDHIQRKEKIARHLFYAIDRDELSLVYQPKVKLSSNEVHSVECLLRWCDGELGHVPPSEFIPIAEENGLIHKLGDWVLDHALQEYKRCSEKADKCKLAPKLAINFSVKQLANVAFINRIERSVHDACVDPQSIIVELTETSFSRNIEDVAEVLVALRARGFFVALDDFGKEYSSLSYLHSYPVDYLKIDKLFIDDLFGNVRCQSIVQSIITMGNKLGLEVVAEGVETKEQVDILRKLKCDYAQGYYFAKPKPIDEL